MSPFQRNPKPEHVAVHSLRAGDVVVYKPGDVRKIHTIRPTAGGRDFTVDWGDGRLSMLSPSRVLVRLVAAPPARTHRPVVAESGGDDEAETTGGTE